MFSFFYYGMSFSHNCKKIIADNMKKALIVWDLQEEVTREIKVSVFLKHVYYSLYII